jgi:hypothetical protein
VNPTKSEESLKTAIVRGDLIPDRALTARDADAFEYEPLADRIADLCCEAEAPVNIALFAPWGSGKSSLFTLIASSLERNRLRTKLIRYDAWRYGGRALRRNFIAHAARELRLPEDDPRYSEFHRGLYQNQRRVSLSAPRLLREVGRGRLTPLLLLGLAGVILGFVLSIDSVLIGAMVSTFVALLAAVIEAGKVEIEQSRPSEDEEFSARFARLIELAAGGRSGGRGSRHRWARRLRIRLADLAHRARLYELRLWWSGWIPPQRVRGRELPSYERLIFFIDELDRCSASDIVDTLKSLRTFLDARRCVFVVAADRDVIEASLEKAEQTTPLNEERPHYSTAGAYIDKIFQHQLTLPPLRSRSLAKFARELACQAGDGVWSELVELDGTGDGATPALDLVLFVLIPSHVYSPRRIKVLLNNYATNVRLARSRLPDVWPERRGEIAKLTALQTEFADFAEDVAKEPRLPRFLLETIRDPEAELPSSDLVRTLVERWQLPKASTEVSPAVDGQDVEAPAEPDQFMTLGAHARANDRRRQELRRYLERTNEVGDLGRDLFYLRSAGLDVGLEDPQLAELIEAEATDSPNTVVEALEQRPVGELRGAARLLASMVGDVLGPEQAGVMTCLMSTVELLGDDFSPSLARDVAPALRTYWNGNDPLEEHLLGALRTAIAVRGFDGELIGKVMGDGRLWGDADRVASIIAVTPSLRDREVELLRGGVIRCLPHGHERLIEAVTKLPGDQQLRLMDDDAVFDAIASYLDRISEEAEGEGEEQEGGE